VDGVLSVAGMVVARIEEEHLWETRQLGAHSPFVLLNTLIYFNTKYFLLKSAEEHLSLSFTDIMKHWKKTNAVGGKAPGKMFFLRYFAPLPPGTVMFCSSRFFEIIRLLIKFHLYS
jgi:hypothetical protein